MIKVDILKTVNSEEVEQLIEDNIKGLIVIFDSLADVEDMGSHKYQKEVFKLVNSSLNQILEATSYTKKALDYMVDKLHEYNEVIDNEK